MSSSIVAFFLLGYLAACNSWAANIDFMSPENWTKTEIPGTEMAWKRHGHARIYMLINANDSGKTMSFKDVPEKTIIQGLSGIRRATLAKFGITDWQMNFFRIQKLTKQDAYKLDLGGHYRNTRFEDVSFRETDYFFQKKIFQISYIEEGVRKISDPKEFEDLSQRFKPEGL